MSLASAPPEVQVGGRSVLLIPVRAGGAGPEVFPADYQQILMIVPQAAGPVKVKGVGAVLGQYVTERHGMAAMIEPTCLLYREVLQDAS